jgi:ABC-type glycerol-3-phosphate transport system substrate-binding protein
MYWNRSIFTDAKLTEPPKYWDEFYDLANLISKKDGALNILKSAVAFGEFSNISNAKAIVLNLSLQAGTPVTTWNGNNVRSAFADTFNRPISPAEAAVNFYTEFGNPAKTSYSWNRSLPNSTSFFLSGDLGLYFGFASEITSLQARNPNLNFDVAPVPTSREGGVNVSFARFNSLAITKSSKNPNAAFSVASILSGRDASLSFAENLRLPSPRRDILNQKPTNAYLSVFYDNTIRAKNWLDPNPKESDSVFKDMIESITSGRARTLEAVSVANREMADLLAK